MLGWGSSSRVWEVVVDVGGEVRVGVVWGFSSWFIISKYLYCVLVLVTVVF